MRLFKGLKRLFSRKPKVPNVIGLNFSRPDDFYDALHRSIDKILEEGGGDEFRIPKEAIF